MGESLNRIKDWAVKHPWIAALILGGVVLVGYLVYRSTAGMSSVGSGNAEQLPEDSASSGLSSALSGEAASAPVIPGYESILNSPLLGGGGSGGSGGGGSGGDSIQYETDDWLNPDIPALELSGGQTGSEITMTNLDTGLSYGGSNFAYTSSGLTGSTTGRRSEVNPPQTGATSGRREAQATPRSGATAGRRGNSSVPIPNTPSSLGPSASYIPANRVATEYNQPLPKKPAAQKKPGPPPPAKPAPTTRSQYQQVKAI